MSELDLCKKTGTTLIVGLIFQDGVILGADTRATDKKCEKIHCMAPNIYCCGDTAEAVTDMVSSQLELHRYQTGRESRVVTALTLLKSHDLFSSSSSYQGHVSSAAPALVLGGVDVTGPHLHTIYRHGSSDSVPFASMGSGSLGATTIFEAKYRQGLTRDEGVKLVSGIFNLMGSRSNSLDICVITKGKQEYLRNYVLPNPRTYNVSDENFSKEAPKAAKSTNLYSIGDRLSDRLILENAIDDEI